MSTLYNVNSSEYSLPVMFVHAACLRWGGISVCHVREELRRRHIAEDATVTDVTVADTVVSVCGRTRRTVGRRQWNSAWTSIRVGDACSENLRRCVLWYRRCVENISGSNNLCAKGVKLRKLDRK